MYIVKQIMDKMASSDEIKLESAKTIVIANTLFENMGDENRKQLEDISENLGNDLDMLDYEKDFIANIRNYNVNAGDYCNRSKYPGYIRYFK